MIPFFTLDRQNDQIRKELRKAFEDSVNGGTFILGPKVSEFEEAFARYIGVKHAVGVACGTDALSLALLAVGVGRGGEVIIPANAYPTAFAVTAIGVTPRLVDIDLETYNIDPALIEKAIAPTTKAIIAVHLYGQPADIERIMEIGRRNRIPVIEDCAQAAGSSIEYRVSSILYKKILNTKYKIQNTDKTGKTKPVATERLTKIWKKVGSIGEAGCFSFYPTKNLGCLGDGGMMVTDNPEIAERVRLLRMYGEKKRYESVLLGRNSRLDELQAAILLVKLGYLDSWNRRRREIADIYRRIWNMENGKWKMTNKNLKTEFQLPIEAEHGKHVYHLFVIRSSRRDRLKAFLEERGIGTAIHYPVPIHLTPSFAQFGYTKRDFPNAERASREVLSLPIFPELTDGEVLSVCKQVRSFFHER